MKRINLVLIAVSAFSIAGCQSTPYGNTTPPTKQNWSMGTPTLTDDQHRKIDSIVYAKGSIEAQKTIAAARQNIIDILEVDACASTDVMGSKKASLSTSKDIGKSFPMMNLQKHNHDHCLSVLGIQNWKIKSDTAFDFKTTFIADDSGETTSMNYSMKKQGNGAWLLNKEKLAN